MKKIMGKLHDSEASTGILIFMAAVAALAVKNSPFNIIYDGFLNIPVAIQFGQLVIAKPLLLWINDGLMAVFFLLVGLELKREFLVGRLADPANVILPAVGAIGGIAMPALIYVLINRNDPGAITGWAIPTATDIAFALGILALLGNRVPPALKLFLLTLAIIDDLVAIIIIAFFYTSALSFTSLGIAAGALAALAAMNYMGAMAKGSYALVGAVLWVALLKSGVHATLAGVVLAMFIPLKNPGARSSPLRKMEKELHHVVGHIILPLFAFANAGISLEGLTPSFLLKPVPMGIGLGLLLGKQLGVFGFIWLAVQTGVVRLPKTFSWSQIYGVALLCGVGFTMSLFISSLAFEHAGALLVSGVPDAREARLGILAGSLASGLLGYLYLRLTLPDLVPVKAHGSSDH